MKTTYSSTKYVGSWLAGTRGKYRHLIAAARPFHARGCFVYRTECGLLVTVEEWLGPGQVEENCVDCAAGTASR